VIGRSWALGSEPPDQLVGGGEPLGSTGIGPSLSIGTIGAYMVAGSVTSLAADARKQTETARFTVTG
jgi:hypothetical protein